MKIADLDAYLADRPDVEQLIVPIQTLDPHRMGRIKPDVQFREHMERIRRNNRGSTIPKGNLTSV